jgi:Ni/Co efflux regulator RcnB
MKKLILAAVATTLVATPLLAATPAEAQRRTEQTVRYKPNGTVVVKERTVRGQPARINQRQAYRQWRKGQRFDQRQARNYRQINDWRAYRGNRLYAPPRGYRWVQSGNDALLVGVAGGVIGAVLAGAFN